MRPMTLRQANQCFYPARGGQLIGPIVDRAHETRFVVAQAARTRDRGLTITENPGNAEFFGGQ